MGANKSYPVVLLLLLALSTCAHGRGFALLMQNAIVNFAFEYQMNVGRTALQDSIPVRSTVVQHVTANITEQTILNLASQGYDMFMFAQVDMIEPALKVAKARPELYFGFIALWPALIGVPNFKVFQFSASQGFYILGYLAGLMTKTNKVGHVGISTALGQSVLGASFSYGVQDANPKAEVHAWTTNTTVEPLATQLGARAVRDLLSRNCDVIMGDAVRKDDTLLRDVQFNYPNTYFVGSNLDLREWLGDAALSSLIFDWRSHIRLMINYVVNGTWPTGIFFNNGDLRNGGTPLAPFSPRVPADVVAAVNARKATFLLDPLSIFCGDRIKGILAPGVVPGGLNGCINSTQQSSIISYPLFVTYHGVMTLPSYEILLDTGLQAGLYVLCGVAGLIAIGFIIFIVVFKDRGVIHYAGWNFCVLMCLGAIIVDVGAALLLPQRQPETCIIQVWLTVVGGSLLVGTLLARQFRLAVLRWYSEKVETTSINDMHVAIVAGVYVFLNIIVLILFTTIQTPDVITHEQGDDPDLEQFEWRWVCWLDDAPTGCLITLVVMNGVVLIVASILAIYSRGLKIKVFDESNWMSLAVFSSAFAGGVSLLAWFTATGFIAKTLVAYACIMITGNVALCWIMLPKIFCVIMGASGSEHYNETDLRTSGSKRTQGTTSAKMSTDS